MKIEKYQKIGKDKYRIFLDNGTIIDIYEDVIVKNNLLYKKEISVDLLNKLEEDNEVQNIYNMAIKYISLRLRSSYEVYSYLKKKDFNENTIEEILEKLIKNNYLNDDIFTKAFIKDKLNFTNMGKYKLINELKLLKVDNEIINNHIEEIEEEIWNERINILINKYLKRTKKNTGNMLKNKIYIYLVNLGYDKSLVINNLNNYNF